MNTNLKNFYNDDKIVFYFENINLSSSLDIYFVNSANRVSIEAEKNSDGVFQINTKDINPKLTEGEYAVYGVYSNSDKTESETIEIGQIKVLESVLTRKAVIKTFNRKMFDAFEDLLQNRSKDDYVQYSIGGRSITKMSFSEMLNARNYYYEQVALEEGVIEGRNRNNKIITRYKS